MRPGCVQLASVDNLCRDDTARRPKFVLKIIYLIECRFGEGYSWPRAIYCSARLRERILALTCGEERHGGKQMAEPALKDVPCRFDPDIDRQRNQVAFG